MNPTTTTTAAPAVMAPETEVEKVYTYGDYLQEQRDARLRRAVLYFQGAAAAAAIIFYVITVLTRRNG